MKVKALTKFNDLKEGKIREQGAVFEVTKERFKEINSHPFGPLIIEVEKNNKKEMASNG
ncbi:hypothetical protein [Tissierella sp.]|uniref:hypothetical protein n=1 Tax=Tissierella sp. TaxID=41274 RepID=UPI00305016D3